jgi:hypothetical protein
MADVQHLSVLNRLKEAATSESVDRAIRSKVRRGPGPDR